MALASGSTFGPFRILDLLGKGGMASVYKAYEAKLNRHVAVKVLRPEFLDVFAKRFEREARVVAMLDHANIVPIHDYGIDDGVPWMSMRLLPGGSLADLLAGQGRLGPDRVVTSLKQVAKALDHAHRNGVIHRDVKPTNVLLDSGDQAYVSDFGIARLAEASVVLTQTDMVAGTPHYMAPEQGQSMRVDHRADIYALGVVAYEMLVGTVPFQADTAVAVLMKHASEPVPIPPREQVSESVMKPVLKALAKAPSDRWTSATAFIDALRRGLRAIGSAEMQLAARPAALAPGRDPASPRGQAVTTSRRPRSRIGTATVILAGLVVTMLLSFSVGGWVGWLVKTRRTPATETAGPPADTVQPDRVQNSEPSEGVTQVESPTGLPLDSSAAAPAAVSAREAETPSLQPDHGAARAGLERVSAQTAQQTFLAGRVSRLVLLGNRLVTHRKYGLAMQRFSQALRLDRSSKAAKEGLVRTENRKAESDAAVAKVIETRIRAKLHEGRQALREERYEAALMAFDVVLGLDGDNQEAAQGKVAAHAMQRVKVAGKPQP